MERLIRRIPLAALGAGALLWAAAGTLPSRAQQPGGNVPAPGAASQQQAPSPAAANPPSTGAPAANMAAPNSSTAPNATPAADAALTVPAGTKVLLAVESPINTKTARQGDGIYLVSTFPVIVGAHVLIPAGVYVQGVVDQVTRPGRVKGRAKLLIHFNTMIFPNGQVVAIPGGVNNLPGSEGPQVRNSEGQIEQAGNTGKDAGTIAKGAAGGAGIGALGGSAMGHPLAGIGYGGLAGAAAGGIYTLFTRGDDINIQSGASIEMVLQRPLTLEPSQLAGINDVQGQPQFVPSTTQQRPLPKPRMVINCPPGSLGCGY